MYLKPISFVVVVLAVVISVTGCNRDKPIQKMNAIPESTLRDMKLLLKCLTDTATFPFNSSLDSAGVAYCEDFLKTPGNEDNVEILTLYGRELLAVGRTEDAAEHYENVLQQIQVGKIAADSLQKLEIKEMLAISYFRVAEQANCINSYSPEACILPFNKGSYHSDSFGTLKCIDELTAILATAPDDYTAKWLLNLANAAIGRDTGLIPEDFRINLRHFESNFSRGEFKNVANTTLPKFTRLAGGAAVADYNNDGLLDLAVTSAGIRDNMYLFLNTGKGTFIDGTDMYGLKGITGGINITHLDFNNDGYEDLYIMRGGWFEGFGNYPNSLLKNNGDGSFTDITYKAGLLAFHPTHTACWADINNDGYLDLFVGNETSDSTDPHPSQLYINNGNETFTEISKAAGVVVNAYVKGAIWLDYNNDGWPDLYISNYLQKNILYRNNGKDKNGRVTFTDVTRLAGVELPLASFPVFAADVNNDGWEDIFVSSYDPDKFHIDMFDEYRGAPSLYPPALYINQKDGTFKDMAKQYNLERTIFCMGLNFGDIDNDGFVDFYAGTGNPDFRGLYPNLLFRNCEGKYFEDITMNTRTGHLQKGHGVAFADFDNDGDLDIYNNVGGFAVSDAFRNALFENPGFKKHYIKLELTGRQSNRNAIGARIRATIETTSGLRNIYATISAGGSYGASAYECLMGLNDARQIKQLEIKWPTSGKVQQFENVTADKCYAINEAMNILKPIEQKRFSFKR